MSENEKLDQTGEAVELSQVEETGAAEAKADKASKDKSAKPAKKDSEKKPGVFKRIVRWFREMRAELKKVSWSSGKDTFKNTIVVLVCVLIVGIFICCFDALAHLIIDALFNLFG